jgi:hypothetical protein
LLVLAFGLLALWFALQAVNGLAESKRLAQSNASLLAQCEQQERQNQERRAAFDNGSLDKQLEEAARRKGYGYPDEWRYRDSKAG